ncbi:MAG: YibE/F family protein [Chloroflexi bacterium]|nr:YibE/F family protein [Chloroflexota bacterium]
MSKLDRFLVVSLIVLLLAAMALVLVGSDLFRPSRSGQVTFEIGDTETLTARVVEVLEEGQIELGPNSSQPYQRLLLRVEQGSLSGQEVVVEEGTINIISQERLFSPGDRVFLERVVGPDADRLYISDFVRTSPLFFLLFLFIVMVMLVGRGRGIRSLLGTALSLVVIFAYILPQIIAGHDPVLVSVSGSIVLLAVSTYVTYGWNAKAHAAVLGMALSLTLTAILAWAFVGWARLTGLSSEESSYLVIEFGTGMDLRGLVLGGMIIGSLGVLDDVCVGQASAVFELVNANRDLKWGSLVHRSLNIGRDHIAAMVNTLLLAYAGASLPLLMVFTVYQEPIWRRLNREPIAEEFVRTLVGSVGLILAVPITALIASSLACWVVQREQGRLGGNIGARDGSSGVGLAEDSQVQ